jgi:hypothetical protein
VSAQLGDNPLHQRHGDRLAGGLGGIEDFDGHQLGGVGLAHG